MSAPSRIRCFVDFDRDGKQISHLQLPFSSNRSAYGWIGIPIAVIKNGHGPTIYLGGGNHGDEYEGQITLVRLIRELDPAEIQGRLIILPATNLPAAMAGQRCSPIDGLNLNRSFPGDPDGPPTMAIAHFIESVLLPLCDAVLDLHSGGRTLDYLPSTLTRSSADDETMRRRREALQAFGAPIGYFVDEDREDRTIVAAAARAGVLAIGTELGGAGTATPTTLAIAREGVRAFLAHMRVMAPNADRVPRRTRLMEVKGPDYYVHAPTRGLFEPAFALGDTVRAGDVAGWIHQIDDPAIPPVEVTFPGSGLVICWRPILPVERGDCLAHMATDLG